jgi:hypothetical protein
MVPPTGVVPAEPAPPDACVPPEPPEPMVPPTAVVPAEPAPPEAVVPAEPAPPDPRVPPEPDAPPLPTERSGVASARILASKVSTARASAVARTSPTSVDGIAGASAASEPSERPPSVAAAGPLPLPRHPPTKRMAAKTPEGKCRAAMTMRIVASSPREFQVREPDLRLSSGAPRACRHRHLSVTSEMLEGRSRCQTSTTGCGRRASGQNVTHLLVHGFGVLDPEILFVSRRRAARRDRRIAATDSPVANPTDVHCARSVLELG